MMEFIRLSIGYFSRIDGVPLIHSLVVGAPRLIIKIFQNNHVGQGHGVPDSRYSTVLIKKKPIVKHLFLCQSYFKFYKHNMIFVSFLFILYNPSSARQFGFVIVILGIWICFYLFPLSGSILDRTGLSAHYQFEHFMFVY